MCRRALLTLQRTRSTVAGVWVWEVRSLLNNTCPVVVLKQYPCDEQPWLFRVVFEFHVEPSRGPPDPPDIVNVSKYTTEYNTCYPDAHSSLNPSFAMAKVETIVFLSLILDLFAFTIPLPLFPRLIEWYSLVRQCTLSRHQTLIRTCTAREFGS